MSSPWNNEFVSWQWKLAALCGGCPSLVPAEAKYFGREVKVSPFSRFSHAKSPLGSRKSLCTQVYCKVFAYTLAFNQPPVGCPKQHQHLWELSREIKQRKGGCEKSIAGSVQGTAKCKWCSEWKKSAGFTHSLGRRRKDEIPHPVPCSWPTLPVEQQAFIAPAVRELRRLPVWGCLLCGLLGAGAGRAVGAPQCRGAP